MAGRKRRASAVDRGQSQPASYWNCREYAATDRWIRFTSLRAVLLPALVRATRTEITGNIDGTLMRCSWPGHDDMLSPARRGVGGVPHTGSDDAATV